MSVSQLPAPLQEVVDQLSSLPGIGPKSALRIALTLLKMPKERASAVGGSILSLRENLCMCERCASLSEASPCSRCLDGGRERSELCLVAEWDALLALETTGTFRGQYMVLGGLLSPLDGTDPSSLEFSRLKSRLEEGEVQELILALGATLDAENTASYTCDMVKKYFPHIKITRLAQGIPMGAEVKFMDKETLKQSLAFRQDL
ncbi:MAG: recombination mediator RecR [Desulfovibrio sp.]